MLLTSTAARRRGAATSTLEPVLARIQQAWNDRETLLYVVRNQWENEFFQNSIVFCGDPPRLGDFEQDAQWHSVAWLGVKHAEAFLRLIDERLRGVSPLCEPCGVPEPTGDDRKQRQASNWGRTGGRRADATVSPHFLLCFPQVARVANDSDTSACTRVWLKFRKHSRSVPNKERQREGRTAAAKKEVQVGATTLLRKEREREVRRHEKSQLPGKQ